jgi:hypothetical protein
MTFFQTWGDMFTGSFQNIWNGVAGILPLIVVAVVFLLLGWFLAHIIERAVRALFQAARVDAALRAAGFESVMRRAGHELNSGAFVGALIKWFVIAVFIVASLDTLHLTQVNVFLGQIVFWYLPQVIAAVLILLVSVVIADAVGKLVVATAKAGHVASAQFLGTVARWSIWIFAIITALYQLNIAVTILNTLVTGVVFAIALAVGLSFGLGGRDMATHLLSQLHDRLSERK